MSRTRPLSRSAALRLWIDRAGPVAAVCLLMIGGGLLLTQYPRIERQNCEALYAHARTAADSVVVDGRWANAKARISCGRLRREGMLDAGPGGTAGG
ncbi:MAG TPA: hypothetical protein VFT45_11945 [Longimicrobium sp.]|nr:hypothetical protein [Longimicrobium sp.]